MAGWPGSAPQWEARPKTGVAGTGLSTWCGVDALRSFRRVAGAVFSRRLATKESNADRVPRPASPGGGGAGWGPALKKVQPAQDVGRQGSLLAQDVRVAWVVAPLDALRGEPLVVGRTCTEMWSS